MHAEVMAVELRRMALLDNGGVVTVPDAQADGPAEDLRLLVQTPCRVKNSHLIRRRNGETSTVPYCISVSPLFPFPFLVREERKTHSPGFSPKLCPLSLERTGRRGDKKRTMPATVADVAARSSISSVIASSQASRFVLKSPSQLLHPATAAAVVGYRRGTYVYADATRCSKYRDTIGKSFNAITGRGRHDSFNGKSSVVCRSNSAGLPSLSLCVSSNGTNKLQQYVTASKDKPLRNLYSTADSLFGDRDSESYKLPKLPRRRSIKPAAVYKNFDCPVFAEKPEWWWRTLACVPYLIALQISDMWLFIQLLVQHHQSLENLTYFIPGAITRLPHWFLIIYCYFGYFGVVKNKEWPYFIRYHLMMGMLLETALQIVCITSNFFPLIHYKGTYGMYYWAGIGLAYVLILMQCVRGALAGGYAYIPFITENAELHVKYSAIGGFQRPW
ncbi:Protein TIC 20-IV, chloroplastic [Linum grandiflorum]